MVGLGVGAHQAKKGRMVSQSLRCCMARVADIEVCRGKSLSEFMFLLQIGLAVE